MFPLDWNFYSTLETISNKTHHNKTENKYKALGIGNFNDFFLFRIHIAHFDLSASFRTILGEFSPKTVTNGSKHRMWHAKICHFQFIIHFFFRLFKLSVRMNNFSKFQQRVCFHSSMCINALHTNWLLVIVKNVYIEEC